MNDIEINEVYEVACPAHGVITTSSSREVALEKRRQHFEWRHQPDPTNRICGWRYPRATNIGDQVCALPAAHEGLQFGDAWTESTSVPRRKDEI